MAHSFSELRKNRSDSFAKVNTELAKLNAPQGQSSDDRFWSPTVDKQGNGYAVVRFLDSPPGEDMPFIRRWDHGFKGPTGSWYIETSLNTIGQDDPVSDMNRKLWAEGEGSEGRKTVSGSGKDKPGSKRRLHYISNVLILEDSAKPENVGKVFLYKYGAKIFDKLNDVMNPKFPDEKAFSPFDLWEGANFRIKIRQVEGYRNYDKSEFDTPAPLYDGDEAKLEAVWHAEHSLKAFLDTKNFKPYAELERKLNKVMGIGDNRPTDAKGETAQTTQTHKSSPEPVQPAATTPEVIDDAVGGDDEGLDFFKKLAAN